MSLAKEAPELAKEAAADKQEALAAVQAAGQKEKPAAEEAPPPAAAPAAQEAFVRNLSQLTMVLREVEENAELDLLLAEAHNLTEERLDESVMGSIGIVLASPKLIMWALTLLSKLAGKFNSERAQSVSKKLHDAGQWVHHAEENVIDKVVPNKAAYLYYKAKTGVKEKLGVAGRSEKQSGVGLTSEKDFANDKKLRMITKMQMHKIMLLPFLLVGLTHIFHAFHSVFGAADALATIAKTAEVGGEVSAMVAEVGPLAAAVAQTDPGALLDLADVAVDAGSEVVDAVSDAGASGGNTTK